MGKGWVGVDLDGTLAQYNGWKGYQHIGDPVIMMQNRVLVWLENGDDVRILTARVSPQSALAEFGSATPADLEKIITPIQDWCLKHLGRVLPITCSKDLNMIEYWDDRCIQVVPNTGLRVDHQEKPEPAKVPDAEKQKGLNQMMIMMRNDLLGHIETLLKGESPIIMQNNRTKGYNQGVLDAIGTVHMYYQGLFGEAIKNMEKIDGNLQHELSRQSGESTAGPQKEAE